MKNRLEAIRSLPCCECGQSPRSQVAHSNWSEHGKGKGIKADDMYTIPLCHDCHVRLDRYKMGMDRERTKLRFLKKLKFVNEVLDDKKEDETAIF